MNICYNCFKEYEGGVCPHCGYNAADDEGKYPVALEHGTVLAGRYVLGRVIGHGGFGITYIAQNYKTKEIVAIKEFFPEALATRVEAHTVSTITNDRTEGFEYGKECFLNEAKTLAEFIGNPHIVRVYSYFEENSTAYFVMEYITGISLQSYLNNNGGKISVNAAKNILFPIMDALSDVHSKGIVHRDISPDNIYITQDGEVKLLDFGAARYSMGDKSRSLDVVLKHGYAPKEQYTRRGRQGPFTDVYSLAATFYRAITGKTPPDSIERMDEDDLIYPSSLGVKISQQDEDALVKALSVFPSERFQSMDEFKNAMTGTEVSPIVPDYSASVSNVDNTQPSRPESKSVGNSAPVSDKPKSEMFFGEKDKKKKSISPKILIIAAACLVVVIAAVIGIVFAVQSANKGDRITSDGFRYSVNDKNNQVCIKGYTGENSNLKIPEKIEGIDVTKIEKKAFAGNKKIKSVEIPDSIENVGEHAFQGCPSITSVSVGKLLDEYSMKRIFDGYASITDVIISGGVTSITYEGFKGCAALESLKICDGVKIIPGDTFKDCLNLKEITLPDSIMEIGNEAFLNTAYYNDESNWEDGVLYIGNHLVASKEKISGDYTIKDGTLTVAAFAFSVRFDLNSVKIPDSVRSIGMMAFYATKYYENEDNWDNDVLYIDNHLIEAKKTVSGSYSVKEGTLSIADNAFCDYSEPNVVLESVSIPDSVKTIGSYAFYKCSNLKAVTIPDSVCFIGESAFNGCKSMETVKIPGSVSEVISATFYECTGLKDVTLSEGVKQICVNAFYNCTSLANINIPSSVKLIKRGAFTDCTSLKSVTVSKDCKYVDNSFESDTKIKKE